MDNVNEFGTPLDQTEFPNRLRKGEFTQKDKAVAVVGCLKHMLDQINNELLPKIELIAHIVCEDSEKKRRVNG